MQVNKIETTKKLKMLDLQMDVLKTSKKKYAITSMEVTELTPDARFVIRINFCCVGGVSFNIFHARHQLWLDWELISLN